MIVVAAAAARLRAKLHYTDTGYEHHQRTPPADELTAILQLVNKFTTNGQKFATSQHLDMWRCWDVDIAMWQICCRIIVSSSVAGVRVVEFGP